MNNQNNCFKDDDLKGFPRVPVQVTTISLGNIIDHPKVGLVKILSLRSNGKGSTKVRCINQRGEEKEFFKKWNESLWRIV